VLVSTNVEVAPSLIRE